MIQYIVMEQVKSNYSLVSLGCARSLVDSEKMIDSLQNNGFKLVAEGSNEAITLLNTCSFIQSAIDETEANIVSLLERKKQGHIKFLVVAGCYPSRYKKPDLENKFPGVDLWVTTQEEKNIHEQLSELVFKKKFLPASQPKPYTKLTPSHYSYLKISEGCNNWCSFCTIPKIRGVHTSKPLDEVMKEANLQIQFGAKELLIIAEDTTCWGEDLYGKPSFPLLLQELGKLPVTWIRPMYIFPSRVTPELIQTMADTPAICHYIDMPIQHVNSRLLKQMNRAHDKDFLVDVLQQFKRTIPDLAIRSTFIVGFPGETQSDFEELLQFIEDNPFTHIGCFAYSEEKETRSAKFEDKIPSKDIQKRIKALMSKQLTLVKKRHEARIGQIETVLYEGQGIARSYQEAPEVDSVIYINNSEALIPGTFYNVKITNSKQYDLIAKIV
jgi:ribosomal protein S12 methylthiotransferase